MTDELIKAAASHLFSDRSVAFVQLVKVEHVAKAVLELGQHLLSFNLQDQSMVESKLSAALQRGGNRFLNQQHACISVANTRRNGLGHRSVHFLAHLTL